MYTSSRMLVRMCFTVWPRAQLRCYVWMSGQLWPEGAGGGRLHTRRRASLACMPLYPGHWPGYTHCTHCDGAHSQAADTVMVHTANEGLSIRPTVRPPLVPRLLLCGPCRGEQQKRSRDCGTGACASGSPRTL